MELVVNEFSFSMKTKNRLSGDMYAYINKIPVDVHGNVPFSYL